MIFKERKNSYYTTILQFFSPRFYNSMINDHSGLNMFIYNLYLTAQFLTVHMCLKSLTQFYISNKFLFNLSIP